MHGWGQWYALAAAAVVIGGHLCGRRGRTWAVIVLLGVVEAAAAIAVVRSQDSVAWLVDQLVVVLVVFGALTGAYRRLRQDLVEQGWARARGARLEERARIAADLHDTLGHDLALLSLQAAGIQVTATDAETRERAAALRAGSAAAIDSVRRIVDLLESEADPDVATVIDRARAAGMPVQVAGVAPAGAFVARLVAEALSNAARHAPDAAVTVTFSGRRVEIVNPIPSAGNLSPAPPAREPDLGATPSARDSGPGTAPSSGNPDRTGSGLVALAGRLERAGGSLSAASSEGLFRLVADIPVGIDREDADYDSGRRRARMALVGTVLVPAVALFVVATGFYAWAVRDASMEPGTFDSLRVGMGQEAALARLPGREAPIRLGHGYGAGCHYYTDGNYPLAYGNYAVCFEGGWVVRLRDSTGRTG
ncbi:sensor histidine kinase [Actinoplanes sp. HUAS TT8]|uniref:sensor histidine kinase n=1 Tax=Actinoplanes sp. HUAS TT8 TaxID=3447453 RepID=UPI003F521A0E